MECVPCEVAFSSSDTVQRSPDTSCILFGFSFDCFLLLEFLSFVFVVVSFLDQFFSAVAVALAVCGDVIDACVYTEPVLWCDGVWFGCFDLDKYEECFQFGLVFELYGFSCVWDVGASLLSPHYGEIHSAFVYGGDADIVVSSECEEVFVQVDAAEWFELDGFFESVLLG
jgi:hypothetical protein